MAIFDFQGPTDPDADDLSKFVRRVLEAINGLDERIKKLEEATNKNLQ